jgi:hypothetical protein
MAKINLWQMKSVLEFKKKVKKKKQKKKQQQQKTTNKLDKMFITLSATTELFFDQRAWLCREIELYCLSYTCIFYIETLHFFTLKL